MTEIRRFTIPGKPRGKGRPRFARAGKFVRTYTPADTEVYENKVAVMYRQAHPDAVPIPKGVPVSLEIVAYFALPESWSHKRKLSTLYHTGKPDADNLLKVVCDGLSGSAFHDDAQVACALLTKCYTDDAARVDVKITAITD